jgi:hypothetical protein
MIKDGIFKAACTFLVARWLTMQAQLNCWPQMSAGFLLPTFAGIALLSFIFIALTTVAFLVRSAPETAHQFTQKLAQVYKCFLLNIDCELVALLEELRFIDAYFFLLKIRCQQSV